MTEVPSSPASTWSDAAAAAAVFAVDPVGLPGIALRAGAGPVRDRWLKILRDVLPLDAPFRRLPPGIADSRLLGGLDLAATLQAGRPVAERGVLAEADGGIVLLTMAERAEPGIVARLAAVLDSGEIQVERDGLGLRIPSRFGVIALDEGASDEERPHAALLDRLPFHLDLDAVTLRDIGDAGQRGSETGREAVSAARARLPAVTAAEPILQAICGTAISLGIESLRASLLALRAARAIAALAGQDAVRTEDAALAARLVLAPRATRLPVPADPEPPEPEQPEPEQPEPDQAEPEQPEPGQETSGRAEDSGSSEPEAGSADQPPDDMVLAAAAAAIPAGLLAQLRVAEAGRSRAKASGRAGVAQLSKLRGRPIGVRRGELKSGAKLDLIETLRAAAPWQRLRRSAGGAGDERRIVVRPDDFRIARLKHRTETTAIFVVDASGSSALNRLAEAKGAVELLLAECYVRRDRVALIAFRGRGAELLLPPTRSLVRAKRGLANLPGGGGTPLAAGIDAAAALAASVARQGATPVVIFMTDGQPNIGRDGRPGRPRAEADARSAAGVVRAAGLTALLIDTSPRPQPMAARLAGDMGAIYLPLPAADAAALSRSVQAAMRTPRSESRAGR
jgi:magnesium chelatase subunit D